MAAKTYGREGRSGPEGGGSFLEDEFLMRRGGNGSSARPSRKREEICPSIFMRREKCKRSLDIPEGDKSTISLL